MTKQISIKQFSPGLQRAINKEVSNLKNSTIEAFEKQFKNFLDEDFNDIRHTDKTLPAIKRIYLVDNTLKEVDNGSSVKADLFVIINPTPNKYLSNLEADLVELLDNWVDRNSSYSGDGTEWTIKFSK